MGDDDQPSVPRGATRHFAPSTNTVVGWQYAIAALERIGPWAVNAMRMGILLVLQQCIRDLAKPKASRDLLTRASELLKVLDQIPWD